MKNITVYRYGKFPLGNRILHIFVDWFISNLFIYVFSKYAIIFVFMQSFALIPSDEMNINVELALHCES